MAEPDTFTQLNPSRRILMGPGPSDIHPRVLTAMATPVIGHLDPEFVQLMNEVKSMAQTTFRTANHMTYVISAPGSAGMESSLINIIEPHDSVVICINGVFGMRMAEICRRIGANVIPVEAPWGEPINPDKVRQAKNSTKVKAVCIVHAETSTGVLQPLEEISEIAHESGALFIVDAVTSYCGADLRVDDWGIDVVYSGTQKCLSAPPGMSPTSFSDRAIEAVRNRTTPVSSWFLDVSLLDKYWSGNKRAYHHTAPVSSIYALREAYRLVLEEGLDDRFARHKKNANLLREGLKDLGVQVLVDPEYRLPMLTVAQIPEGVSDQEVRSRLLREYNIEIGGGLGKFAGHVWRIGLMGEGSNVNFVNALLGALKSLL